MDITDYERHDALALADLVAKGEVSAHELVDAAMAAVTAHDPEAMENVQTVFGDKVTFCEQPMDALNGADALAICTEWDEFRNPDFAEMKKRLASPLIFDGRNLYEPRQMREAGFDYHSIGRRPVTP